MNLSLSEDRRAANLLRVDVTGSDALASNARAVRAGVIDPRQERLILKESSCCFELGGKPTFQGG